MSRAETWSKAERVLCVRLDALGDVLMTGPALRAMKQARAGRTVTLLTSPSGFAAARIMPDVDEVIVYDAPWMKSTQPRSDSRPEHSMAERLRKGRFDAAVIFTVYSQNPLPSAVLCYLADIPLRAAHCRENPYQLLTDWIPDPEPHKLVRHEVRRQLDLVASVGAHTADERMAVRVPAGARQRVAQRLRELKVDLGRPWVLIHPGSSAPSRRYPADAFAEAARQLVVDFDTQVVFTGSAEERPLVHEVRAAMGAPSSSTAGELELGELAALIWLAPVLVSNNTGPVHLAASVGTPVVDLYALTNPQHTPWGVPNRVLYHDVPCKYCYQSVCPEGHHHCLTLVNPAEVVRAARELIEGRGPGTGSDKSGANPEENWGCLPLASMPHTTTLPPASSATAG